MRCLLIANPAAGGGSAPRVAEHAQRELQDAGHQVRTLLTDGSGHAEKLAREAAPEHDALIAVGGDGTLHELVNGLIIGSQTPPCALAVLPCGSGDSFARDLDLRSPEAALERMLYGATRRVDLARVELREGASTHLRLAINVLAWGAGARINARAERLRWARARRYDLATLIELASLPALDGTIVRNHVEQRSEYIGIASLTRYSGNGLCLAPHARLDDGLIDLVSIRRGSRFALAALFAKVFKGAHLGSPLVQHEQLASFDLELWPGAELVLDGELLHCDGLSVSMLPAALEVLA